MDPAAPSEAVETLSDDNTRPVADTIPKANASEVFVKMEKSEEGGSASLLAKAAQSEKRKSSESPSPTSKRMKPEPKEDEWDDGGIADDDLAGL